MAPQTAIAAARTPLPPGPKCVFCVIGGSPGSVCGCRESLPPAQRLRKRCRTRWVPGPACVVGRPSAGIRTWRLGVPTPEAVLRSKALPVRTSAVELPCAKEKAQRQESASANQQSRQQTASSNQASRQETSSANQAQRQDSRNQNVETRQTEATQRTESRQDASVQRSDRSSADN